MTTGAQRDRHDSADGRERGRVAQPPHGGEDLQRGRWHVGGKRVGKGLVEAAEFLLGTQLVGQFGEQLRYSG